MCLASHNSQGASRSAARAAQTVDDDDFDVIMRRAALAVTVEMSSGLAYTGAAAVTLKTSNTACDPETTSASESSQTSGGFGCEFI